MDNFIFENATKTFFGKGCVKEYLCCLTKHYGENVMFVYGGGSIRKNGVYEEMMDCCKAISMAAVYEGDIWQDFFERPGIMEFEPLPVGVVATAAGTGSEMNGCAVVTNEERKVKTGRDYPKCNPRFALLDPAYTCGMPRRQMISGGFDVLSRIMEIYFSAPDQEMYPTISRKA